ncbi:ECF-type sigma factor [Rubrivirga marina]|uniref:RNA polymerase sigma-70 ECF-like HTH domain-containing protein n=1 Tax=Rubrivirga marina TaxID=1196024 RepID=A0A271J139_9BACT|nr:ECF-type sigma factor [Rubrivirga marina]PAP77241.1 hypothetical protein BSZ37_12760 [Rubrivirga marina]
MPASDPLPSVELSDGLGRDLDALLPRVYDELRRIAHGYLGRERHDHTLCTTALVHEAYLRLAPQGDRGFRNRGHMLALASIAMRRVLVNYARDRSRDKRGGGVPPLRLSQIGPVGAAEGVDVLALDDALAKLARVDDRAARVVECRFFGGLTVEETAGALGVGTATVKRDWRLAKAWLHRALEDG